MALADIQRFESVVAAWSRLRAREHTRMQGWSIELAAMAEVRDRIIGSGGWVAGPSALMGVLGLTRAEVANCKIVRWLCDPLARHGIGAAMVSALAKHLDFTASQSATVRALTEVTAKVARADIVLDGTEVGRAVVIEAKIGAGEGGEQGARLESDWPNADRFVFLTVRGTQLPNTAADPSRWRALSWLWVAHTAEALVGSIDPPTDERGLEARQAVQAWATGARRYLA